MGPEGSEDLRGRLRRYTDKARAQVTDGKKEKES
jgi:hypothetical protein